MPRRAPLAERAARTGTAIAGGVEEGESFADAAVRELHEETGLRRAAGRDRRAVRYPVDYNADGITVDCFLVDVPDGWEPTLNDEHDEYRWCSPTRRSSFCTGRAEASRAI